MRESPDALQALTEAIGTAVHADAAIVRFADERSGQLIAGPVWASSSALSAELVGSRRPSGAGEDGARSVLRVPIRRGEDVVGELELLRHGDSFDDDDASLAESAAAQAGLVLVAAELAVRGDGPEGRRKRELALAGEALAIAASGNA
ncbi:MAG: GAF domain-containing protein, partial [Actinobacteria bacterium]|nr:GAF domain-containing protein [Actinomycetota bacterium]